MIELDKWLREHPFKNDAALDEQLERVAERHTWLDAVVRLHKAWPIQT